MLSRLKLGSTVAAFGFLALLIGLSPTARAQNAGQIIDFFQQQLQNEVQRQQQREFQRTQRQQYQAQYEQLQRDWQACASGDISACDRGLSSPIASPSDQQQLMAWRNAIIAREQSSREQAAREERARQQTLREQAAREEAARQQAAREELARQQAIRERTAREEMARQQAAREELARQQAIRERTAREEMARQQAERERAAREELTRLQAMRERMEREELARQQARREEAQREEQRRAELNAYATAVRRCGDYVSSACDLALQSKHLVATDTGQIHARQETIRKFAIDRDACSAGQVASCDLALASPAADATMRERLQSWRDAAPTTQRMLALLPAASRHLSNVPTSTVFAGIAALLLGALLIFSMNRNRVSPAGNGFAAAPTLVAQGALPLPVLAKAEAPPLPSGTAQIFPISPVSVEQGAEKSIVPSPEDEAPSLPSVQVAHADQGDTVVSVAKSGSDRDPGSRPVSGPDGLAGSVGGISQAPSGASTALFVIGYILLMIPTYILPYAGSNSYAVHVAAGAFGMITPAFLLHFGLLVGIATLTWFRGARVNKRWLVLFPLLALVFDLAPGLNLVPMVPTVMHLLAIILGVISTTPAATRS